MSRRLLLGVSFALIAASVAWAETPPIAVTIKNHQFTPNEIKVPANQPVVLNVTNADALAEEFDSSALKVEKVIAGGQSGLVRIHPLRPGRYAFTGEYHSATAQGVVVVQ
jgi:heme/copper-type cytochrome/quinol oxidase subunit 2